MSLQFSLRQNPQGMTHPGPVSMPGDLPDPTDVSDATYVTRPHVRGGAGLLLSIPQNWAYYEGTDHVKLFPSYVAVTDHPGSSGSASGQRDSFKASPYW